MTLKVMKPPLRAFAIVVLVASDVLILGALSGESELANALWAQGMVAHHLTVTDRRNGDQLAFMNYVVDLKNGRACGANVEGAIDIDTFVLQATHVPIVLPDRERQRLDNVKKQRTGTLAVNAAIILLVAGGFIIFGRKRVRD